MKKFALLIVLAGCASAQVDPDNGVSNSSYRQSISKAEGSVAAVVTRLHNAQKADRSDAWWAAVTTDLEATRDQLHDTLLGATK